MVYNPLAPLHEEVADLLTKRVDSFLRKSNLDMFLLGLSEADLIRFEQKLCVFGGF